MLRHVGVNPTRVGVINILRQMGTSIELSNEQKWAASRWPTFVFIRRAEAALNIPEDQVPLAIDEFPVLFVAAACAEGRYRAYRRRRAAG